MYTRGEEEGFKETVCFCLSSHGKVTLLLNAQSTENAANEGVKVFSSFDTIRSSRCTGTSKVPSRS